MTRVFGVHYYTLGLWLLEPRRWSDAADAEQCVARQYRRPQKAPEALILRPESIARYPGCKRRPTGESS